jgi:xanthine dehydrogenase molybdenum-binding subunit
MDISKAEALKGVRAILRFDDPEIFWPDDSDSHFPTKVISGYARWYGQPLGALVVADNETLCDEALRLVGKGIQWEVLDFYLDWNEAGKPDAAPLFPDLNPDNNLRQPESTFEQGDIEAGLAEASNIIQSSLEVEEDVWAGAEGGGALVELNDNCFNSGFILKSGHHCQRIWLLQQDYLIYPMLILRHATMVVTAAVALNNAPAGGNPTLAMAMVAAKATGRPVRALYDGSTFRGHGEHAGVYNHTIGFTDDGKVTAVKLHPIYSGAASPMEQLYKQSFGA